jgi:hypothetical protein
MITPYVQSFLASDDDDDDDSIFLPLPPTFVEGLGRNPGGGGGGGASGNKNLYSMIT